ncbi:MAG TPA: TolC family protein, partial [Thermodesulfobacteriota bacterium]|nr:TolC family protein [Thermodesulfobacteriota bacterium]
MRAISLLPFFLLFVFGCSSLAEEKTEVLTLDEAIRIALEHNPDLMASDASIDIMKARVQNARSALYPQVEFRFIIPFIERESGIFADQLIWDFGRTPNVIKSNRAQLESSRFDKAATEGDVILNTKVAYYTVLAQKHILEAAEKTLMEKEKLLEQTEGFFKAGRRSKLDVTKAKVDVGNARLNLLTAKNDLE